MCLDDWVKWFDDVSMIHVNNVSQLALGSRWYEHIFQGAWQGETAGGCVNYPDTFLNNPQVRGQQWEVVYGSFTCFPTVDIHCGFDCYNGQ